MNREICVIAVVALAGMSLVLALAWNTMSHISPSSPTDTDTTALAII